MGSMKAFEKIFVVGTEGGDESYMKELGGCIQDRRIGSTIAACWSASYKETNSFDNYLRLIDSKVY